MREMRATCEMKYVREERREQMKKKKSEDVRDKDITVAPIGLTATVCRVGNT